MWAGGADVPSCVGCPRPPAPVPAPPPLPPTATRSAARCALEAHGDVRIDDWFWLRDKDDPEVIAHLEAENAYTEAGHGRHRRRSGRPCTTRSWPGSRRPTCRCPVRKGPWLYYGRTVEGSSYGIHCRRPRPAGADGAPGTGDGPTRTSRSSSTRTSWPRGTTTSRVGNLAVSPDHRWLAYSTDTTGGERYTMRFLDLATGTDVARGDRGHLLRGGLGQRQRHRLLRPGRRGHAPVPALAPPGGHRSRRATPWCYEEPDDRFYLGVGRTKDDRYVLCGLDSKIDLGGPGPRRRRPDRRVRRDRAPPPGHRVQRRPRPRRPVRRPQRPVPHRHQRRGRGLPADGGPRGDSRDGTTGARSSRPGPGCGSTASTRSPTTWSSTSARRARPGSG